jgi:chromosomal replication initiator protein
MTSDRKPADIPDLADRLKSRFEGGMVADISTPDSELKTAICVLKARKRGIELSNSLAFSIANSVENIRGLEGKLQQVIMTAQTKKVEITPELIGEVLNLPTATENRPDARVILDRVCEYYQLPIKLIKGEKRDKPIAMPRQIVMYLLKKKTRMTLDEIGDYLGGRDHTTILHGVAKIEELVGSNSRTKTDVDKIVDSF